MHIKHLINGFNGRLPVMVLRSWIVLIFLFLAAALPLLSSCHHEQRLFPSLSLEERAWLDQNPEKLILYFNQGLPPIEFTSDEGQFMGMAAGVIANVENRLGITFIKHPSGESVNPVVLLQRGESAIAPAMVHTLERESFALFTTPYTSIPLVVITDSDFLKSDSLNDLRGRRVAAVAGFASEDYLRSKAGIGFEIVPVSSTLEGLLMVSLGQVDAMIENLAVAAYYIEKGSVPNLRVACHIDKLFDLSIGVNRRYPLLHSAIQKALDVMSEKERDALSQQWKSLGVSYWLSPQARRMIKLGLWFVLLLLVGLSGISYVLKRRLNRELSNLKKAHEEILDQAEFLRLATEATEAWSWDFYPAKGMGRLSKQWYDNFGYEYKASEVSLEEWGQAIHPDDRVVSEKIFRNYIDSGGQGQYESEFRIRRADGAWCWVMSRGKAVAWDGQGIPSRVIGLNMSIQTIKEIQEGLAQSEMRFRTLFEYAPYAITIHSLDGRFIDANRVFLDSRHVTKEKVLQMKSDDFAVVSDEYKAAVMHALTTTGSVRNYEAEIKKHDGTIGHMIYSSALLDINGVKQILSITMDVTEKKNAERALRESEQRFRSLFKKAPLPMANVTQDGRFVELNDRFTQVLGYSMDDLPTMDCWWSFAYPDPEYREQAQSEWKKAMDMTLVNKTEVDAREYRVSCKDGHVRNMIIGATLIGDEFIASLFDITDRKKADQEREKLQEQLLQSQKLEAIGILAGGVAHDFNNMLGAIIGYTELTLGEMDSENPYRQNLGQILDAAHRSASLTRQLLIFARKQTVAPVVFDLNESIGTILSMLRRLIGENISLNWQPGKDARIVEMDPSQLDQILANLCVNARDAIEDVGEISIETDTVVFDEEYCKYHEDFNPGEYILLTISDNGAGMSKETRDHIFEPFFTTKGLGEGTGLGLATVYGIIRQNNGFIKVYSEPGQGTAFKLFIPRHLGDMAVKRTAISEKNPKSQGETILIIEDDPTLLRMGTMMLKHLGYNVISAGTPGEAIRLAENQASGMHLFITDVVMPEMNGRELAARLQKIRPEIKHLFMSGYTANVIVHHGVLDKDINFIQKPFSRKDLAIKIREVLD